ncbi:MAG: hypothetical protein AB7U62_14235 [Pseudolabrys sp.]
MHRITLSIALVLALPVSGALAADLAAGGGYAPPYGYGAYAAGPATTDVYEFVGQDPVYVRDINRPWLNRHYFPGADRIPVSGRLEVLPKRRGGPPEDYYRSWSTPPGYSEIPPPVRLMRPRQFEPVPDDVPQK